MIWISTCRGRAEVFLDIDLVRAECGQGLLLGEPEGLRELVLIGGHAHPLAAPARRGLDDHGEPDLERHLEPRVDIVHRARRAGHGGDLQLVRELAGGGFVAHLPDLLRRGTDERDIRGRHRVGKLAVFREKSVSRMNRVGARDFRGRDEPWNVEVAVARGGAPDAHVVVREPDVQRFPVRLGVDGHRPESQFLARADHPQGDLPAVGNEDFCEHQGVRSVAIRPAAPPDEPPNALLAAESTPDTLSANSLGLVA